MKTSIPPSSSWATGYLPGSVEHRLGIVDPQAGLFLAFALYPAFVISVQSNPGPDPNGITSAWMRILIYTMDGSRNRGGSAEEKSWDRQRNLERMEQWRFPIPMESFPLILRIALILLGSPLLLYLLKSRQTLDELLSQEERTKEKRSERRKNERSMRAANKAKQRDRDVDE